MNPEKEGLSQKAKSIVKQILDEYSETGKSALHDQLWRVDYERKPVGIRQFIEDEDYLGKSVKELKPVWKDELEEAFSKPELVELILTGSIGCGKTTVGIGVAIAYKIYCLSCLKNPAEFYGLLSKSEIVFGVYNITLDKAQSGYDLLKRYTDESPYFKENCPRRKRPDEPIYFPRKNIKVVTGSLEEHALGDSLLCFAVDEANFFKRSRNTPEITRVEELYNQARIRIVSRFMRAGVIPGLVILISSRKTQTSFVERKLERVKVDARLQRQTHVVSMPLWSAKDPKDFSGETFEAIVGDDKIASRVLEPDEVPPKGVRVEKVPVEYQEEFLMDADASFRDIAGIATVSSRAFFPRKDMIHFCYTERKEPHPFTKLELLDIGLGSGNKIEDYLIVRQLFRVEKSQWVPRIDPEAMRCAHVDIGVTGDALGLAVGHKRVRKPDGLESAYLDFVLRVKAPMGSEVDLEYVLDFFKFLRTHGFRFSIITYDRYESRQSVQMLTKRKMASRAAWRSVRLEEYTELKRLISSGQASYYKYPTLIRELEELEKNTEDDSKRPNHPPGGSDDVADAVAAVVSHCKVSGNPFSDGKDKGPVVRRKSLSLPIIGLSNADGSRIM